MKPSVLLAAAALQLLTALPAQLPPMPSPPENPPTPAKVLLGKALFWEEQLSHDDTVACATCHQPESGGTDPRLAVAGTPVHPGPDSVYGTADDRRGSPGVVARDTSGRFAPSPTFGLRTQVTPRLASTTLGAGYHFRVFWDGRADVQFVDPETQQALIAFGGALENQALGPILSPVEMGRDGRTWADVEQKLARVRPLALAGNLTPDLQQALQGGTGYPALFQAAFGDPAISAARIAFAIASYERTLVPDQTPWDDYQRGNRQALTPNQIAGWQLFQGNGRCLNCHLPPFFSDDQFHNLGNRPWGEDVGRYAISGLRFERGAFKTPTLRNAGLRPRGFHDGSMPPLGTDSTTDPNSMVLFYLHGGGAFRDYVDTFLLDLSQLGVTVADMLQLEDFVRFGLTDPRAAQGLPPFDHPTLRSQRLPPARVFGLSLAGGSEPFVIDTAPAWPGNTGFQLGVAGGQGGGMAALLFAFATREPGATVAGLPLNLASPLDAWLLPLQGAPGAIGYATRDLPIPASPLVLNLHLACQVLAMDPAAPGGIAASRGVEFTVR